MNKQLKIALILVTLQAISALLFFIGFLLDPLLGLIIAGCYFFIITPFFMFHYLEKKFGRNS